MVADRNLGPDISEKNAVCGNLVASAIQRLEEKSQKNENDNPVQHKVFTPVDEISECDLKNDEQFTGDDDSGITLEGVMAVVRRLEEKLDKVLSQNGRENAAMQSKN